MCCCILQFIGQMWTFKILLRSSRCTLTSKLNAILQVIVVPIFWNRKPAEKASVIRAANKIVAILQGQGLTSGMDTTNSLSPGQKFEFW